VIDVLDRIVSRHLVEPLKILNAPTTMKRKSKPTPNRLIARLISFSYCALSLTLIAEGAELPNEIQKLNESYEREIARVLPPIQEKYIQALEQLLEKYTKAGLLEEAMQTKKQIESAKRWESIPLEQFRRQKSGDLNRSEFEDWLKTKSFSFRGVTQVTLEFDDKKVRWIVGGKPQEYDYKVRGKRNLVINGAQEFRMEFVDDLSRGTFESNAGKYDLTIVDRK
jgi:hypothetical protein